MVSWIVSELGQIRAYVAFRSVIIHNILYITWFVVINCLRYPRMLCGCSVVENNTDRGSQLTEGSTEKPRRPQPRMTSFTPSISKAFFKLTGTVGKLGLRAPDPLWEAPSCVVFGLVLWVKVSRSFARSLIFIRFLSFSSSILFLNSSQYVLTL